MNRAVGIVLASALWLTGMMALISTVPDRLPLCTNGQHKLFCLFDFESPSRRCPDTTTVTESPPLLEPAPSLFRLLAEPSLSAQRPQVPATSVPAPRTGV